MHLRQSSRRNRDGTTAGSRGCPSSTSIGAPGAGRVTQLVSAATQKISCATVKLPTARAWASGVEPANAPGLRSRISR